MDDLSHELLEKFNAFVSSAMGLHFPESRLPDLERAARSAARDFGIVSAEEFIRQVTTSPVDRKRIEALASHLTVGETYFFREKEAFSALEETILPAVFKQRAEAGRTVRVWSAGCSTGEEPYSIAMLLSRLIDVSAWNVTILATDVNPGALKKAEEGVYTEWSFRGTPEWIRDKHFEKTGHGRFRIEKKIRKMVVFSYLNLAEDAYPSLLNNTNAMDIIFCRNVLMYFTEERAKKTVNGLYNSLVDGGYLFLSSTEGLRPVTGILNMVNVNGALLYRKEDVKSAASALPSSLEKPAARDKTHRVAKKGAPGGPPLPSFPAHSNAVKDEAAAERPLPAPPGPRASSPAEQDETFLRAVSAFDAGRYHDAVDELARVTEQVALAPHSALLAKAHANLGALGTAETWCRRAIKTDKVNPYYHYLLATILQEEGRLEEAAGALKSALYLDHDFALAHFVLGNLMHRKGRAESSARCFRNALEAISGYEPGHIVPFSDGITAGRLKEIIETRTSR